MHTARLVDTILVKYVGDYDLSLKLSEVGDVIYLQRPLYFYRVRKQRVAIPARSRLGIF